MSVSNSMIIAMSEIEGKIDAKAPIKERLKQAMKLAMNHWLVVDEDTQFRCALGAVAASASPEERLKITEELALLKGISAAANGLPIDFQELWDRAPENPYGLQVLWMEVKEASP